MEFITLILFFYFYTMWDFIKTPLWEESVNKSIKVKNAIIGYAKQNSAVLIVSLIFLWLIAYQNYESNIELAKKDIQIETASKKSEIEELLTLAETSRVNADKTMNLINLSYEEIKTLEKEYETHVLTKKCYQSQIQRKADWLDYSWAFCKESQNLEQFKTAK